MAVSKKEKKDKDFKLDISTVLSAADKNDKAFYGRLSDDEKKSFSAWTIMRFLSNSNSYTEHYLLMVNSLVNEDFNTLSKHPELQWKLLSLCGVGAKQYHQWLSPARKKGKNKIQEFLSTVYIDKKNDELALLEKIYSTEELVQLAKDAGCSDDEIEKYFN